MLGEILVKRGLITQDELKDALQYQSINKEFLGQILLRKGLITERQLLEALSEQLGIPLVSLEGVKIDLRLTDMFSKSLILDHKCFPLRQTADMIIMAVTDPLDAWVVTQAEEEVKDYRVERVLVSSSEMEWLLDQYRRYQKEKIKKLFGGGV